jgi:cytochrome c peroxidase
VLALVILSPQAGAHIVREAPWDPVAAAYLDAIFITSLDPIDWQAVADRYNSPGGDRAVLVRLAAVAPDAAAELEQAIEQRDAARLRAASTRAMSVATREALAAASSALGTPGQAQAHLARAQELFRAFDRFIREADPEAYRQIGAAWLELTSEVGTAGIGNAARRAADRDRFAAAARTITEFLAASYEAPRPPGARAPGPVPPSGRGADASWQPAPWLPPGAFVLDQEPLPRLLLGFEAQGVDERKLPLVAYGDMLFDSPELFGEPARGLGIACSSCHNRGEANRQLFIPGLSRRAGGVDVDSAFFNPIANDHIFDPVDTPSLRGIRYTAPYGRDGRIASLREFVATVIVTEFGGPEPTPFMLDALVAYLNQFEFLPAPYLDRDGRLNDKASASAKRGEELFHRPFAQMGDRSCASCHLPSALFLDGKRHDVGSGGAALPFPGAVFDTPTLLGAAHTAPYFHDGSLATLADVVAWFDERFGLGLNAGEKSDLAAYLEAIGTAEEPYQEFAGKSTRFRLDFQENSVFASTLDALIPRRDRFHALLLIRSVAGDLRLDASAITDVRLQPRVYELAERLERVGAAIRDERWDDAAKEWSAYKAIEKSYEDELY